MGIFGVRSCRESDWLVTSGKLDIEPSDQRMDEVVSPTFQDKWSAEAQIGRLDRIEIDGESCGWFCDTSFHLHYVNERFCQGRVL